MKKFFLAFAMIIILASPAGAKKTLGDIFGNSSSDSSDNFLTNLVEGVFTKTNITVDDITGIYKASGPAVCFKSDNMLKKAGGIAAASKIESELSPYYRKYSLDNMKLTINADKTFEMQIKNLVLKGTISHNAKDGTFEFAFSAFGKIPLGSMTTYIQKSINSIDLMFDATKLKNFLSSISKYTNISMVKTIGSILDGYDGLCIGWKLSQTGKVAKSTSTTTKSTGNTKSTSGTSGKTNGNNSSEAVENGLNILKETLSKKKK